MHLPEKIQELLEKEGIKELRPGQQKSVDEGIFEHESLLVCTPTASGKTVIAEMAFLNHILNRTGKAIYIVPLKALASEKLKEFKRKYSKMFRIAMAIGDLDSPETHLGDADLIICTSEKLDSLLRHHTPWLKYVTCLIIDEIHLLNEPGRGPTLEIIITILKKTLSNMQLIGLSATIGNPKELSDWLGAKLILDTWRPTKLHKGILLDGEAEFFEDD